MRRTMMIWVVAAMVAWSGALPGASVGVARAAGAAASADSMARLHIILQKLQDAMASMKDFDKLEKAGMPKAQVDRMRRAMQMKINQMMEEAIKNIHSL